MLQHRYSLLLLIVGLLVATSLQAQTFPGYHTSQYAGIHAVPFNPASAAGSRYRWDVNIAGLSANGGNTYMKFNKASLLSGDSLKRFVDWFPDTLSKNQQHAWGSVDIMLPSALYSIDETQSIAFTWRVRASFNGGNMQTPTANFFALGFPPANYYNRILADSYGGAYGHAWNEFGFTYAKVFRDVGDHRWKGGITLKYLGGQAAGSAVGRDGSFVYENRSRIDINSGKLNYAYNAEMDAWDGSFGSLYSPFQNPGIGADVGVIYEWRPDSDGFGSYYEDDTWNPDADTWKARIGVSVVDIGGISYNRSPYTADLDMRVQDYDAFLLEKRKGESISQYARRLRSQFEHAQIDSTDKFFMNLPTSVNLMADYNIDGRFFISASATIGLLSGKKDDDKTHALTQLLVTPRYETEHFGAYLPISVNQYGQADAGLGLRAGPLVIGSASLFSNLVRSSINHADVFVALRLIPIHFNRGSWDKGNGGIFRKRRNNLGCPSVP
ncbi:hypothetical protein GFS24_02700 [Chitinophaga sp. SYP-B3965]|uniref:DUF5723 family protein n=1 Tax=Chitinophaga sp. SYP-B3965 TaxID=2663120 RepID=UPI0012999802|nr:DUF5723 family protein [Chitinophaga sp. SYP-B3965]MRG44003.1 hypothetical protein [Chitinophaga sp. SYP-B3965]